MVIGNGFLHCETQPPIRGIFGHNLLVSYQPNADIPSYESEGSNASQLIECLAHIPDETQVMFSAVIDAVHALVIRNTSQGLAYHWSGCPSHPEAYTCKCH